jgi:hypothetical protein
MLRTVQHVTEETAASEIIAKHDSLSVNFRTSYANSVYDFTIPKKHPVNTHFQEG